VLSLILLNYLGVDLGGFFSFGQSEIAEPIKAGVGPLKYYIK